MIPALLLLAVAAPQDAPPSVPPVAKPVVSIDPAPIAVPLVSAMSPDHQRLAVETRDDGVWILNLTTKTWDLRIKPKDPHTIDIAWSADGTKLALVGSQGPISIVDSVSGKVGPVMATQHQERKSWEPPDLIAFAAGGDVLVAGLGSDNGDLWSTARGNCIASLPISGCARPSAMATSRDGEFVALGSTAGTVTVWKARTGESVASLPSLAEERGQGVAVNSLDFTPSGKVLAIGSGDCDVRVWTVGAESVVRKFSFHDVDDFTSLSIGHVRFDSTGARLLATAFDYWQTRAWDVDSGKLLGDFDFYRGGNPTSMPAWFSTDGTFVIVSLGCRMGGIVPSPISAGAQVGKESKQSPPTWAEFDSRTRYASDGEYAWAEERGELVVRSLTKPPSIVRVTIASPAKGAGGK